MCSLAVCSRTCSRRGLNLEAFAQMWADIGCVATRHVVRDAYRDQIQQLQERCRRLEWDQDEVTAATLAARMAEAMVQHQQQLRFADAWQALGYMATAYDQVDRLTTAYLSTKLSHGDEVVAMLEHVLALVQQ